jgi:hypothetical protein
MKKVLAYWCLTSWVGKTPLFRSKQELNKKRRSAEFRPLRSSESQAPVPGVLARSMGRGAASHPLRSPKSSCNGSAWRLCSSTAHRRAGRGFPKTGAVHNLTAQALLSRSPDTAVSVVSSISQQVKPPAAKSPLDARCALTLTLTPKKTVRRAGAGGSPKVPAPPPPPCVFVCQHLSAPAHSTRRRPLALFSAIAHSTPPLQVPFRSSPAPAGCPFRLCSTHWV